MKLYVKGAWLLLVFGLFFAAGDCLGFAEDSAENGLVAKIGNKKIYLTEIKGTLLALDRSLEKKFDSDPQWRSEFIRNYVVEYAFARRAQKEGLDKNPDIILRIDKAHRTVLADYLLENRLGQIQYSVEDLQRYYEQNKTRYQGNGKIRFSYALIEDQSEAEAFRSGLAEGKSFAKLAGKKKKKGDWVSRDSAALEAFKGVAPGMWDQVFSLKEGQTSAGFETPRGFYFFHLEENKGTPGPSFQEMRAEIEKQYSQEVRNQAVADLVRETFDQEVVQFYEEQTPEKKEPGS